MLCVVCLHYTYFFEFVNPYWSNSFQIIKKVKIEVCTRHSPIIISIIFSPLLFILSHMGLTSLVNLSQKSLEKTRIVISRCCIRSYVSRGSPGAPKSLLRKGLRQSSSQNPCHTPRPKSGHIRQISTNKNKIITTATSVKLRRLGYTRR